MGPATPACACFEPRGGSGAWWRLGSAAFLAVNAMVLGLAVNGSEVTASERFALESATGLISLGIAVLLGGELVAAAWRARGLSLELLFLSGIAASFTASLLSLFHGMSGTYFDVAGLLLLVYSLGREVGRYGQQRVLSELTVSSHRSGLQKGDTVQVLPGQPIPVDGVILRGAALVQDANLTGESFARPLQQGDRVRAGAFPLDASLWIEATATAADSEIEKVRALMLERLAQPGPTLALAQRALTWFIPTVTVAALGTLLWHWQANPWPVALSHAMSVLVIACPCALGFAAPLTGWSAMARLRQIGIVCRSGEALERLADVDTVVFDKTGTLSAPETYAVTMEIDPGWDGGRDRLLRLLSTAERASAHPIARAMAPLWAQAAPLAENGAPAALESIRLLPGRGLSAVVIDGGKPFLVEVTLRADSTRHALAVRVDGEAAATVYLDESLRPALDETLDGLTADRLQLVLATGDGAARAAVIPIPDQHSRQTPQQKLALVDRLNAAGHRVLFLGDGLNDGPAMAASHVGMTLATASPAILEVASLLNQSGDWRALPVTLRIARQAVGALRRNIAVALGYNLLGMAVAAAGWLSPVTAALLMTVSSITVVLMALNVLNIEVSGEERVLVD
ncbi:MAG: heavy metal translocating P-type ATPase [Acidobacteriota bacterium]|jgi:Cu2+-exporting ATPase/Cu+-exporting ATPase|nr:cation-translocating P-type ATPase [Acidobacteriaceae bacterium]